MGDVSCGSLIKEAPTKTWTVIEILNSLLNIYYLRMINYLLYNFFENLIIIVVVIIKKVLNIIGTYGKLS